MMRALLLLPLFLLACPKDPDDSAEGDTDADTDADTDTDTDADADTDADTDLWAHCPGADAYVGEDGWTASVEVAADAVWCGSFDESRTIEEELAAKAQMKLVEGSYPVPSEKGAYALALPACTRRAPGLATQDMAGAGSTEVTLNVWSGTTYTTLTGTQPMDDGTPWELQHTLRLVGPEGQDPEPLALDGGPADATTGAGADFYLLPEGGSPWDVTTVRLVACFDEDTWHREVHTVTFDGGQIELELWIGMSMASTEPGRFTAASGTLDGVDFATEDYFQLIYNPTHHHFTRDFAVLLPTPVGEVCALRVEQVDPWDEGVTAVVSTAACDLGVIETRAVTDETFVRED